MSQSPHAPHSPIPVTPLNSVSAPHTTLFSRDFILLCVGTFLFAGSMFLLFAVLPIFVVQELKGAESQVGLIMGAFAVTALLARPFSGRLVDIRSRKTGLSLGAFIYFLCPILYTLAGSVPVMLGFRCLHGIGIAVYTLLLRASLSQISLHPPDAAKPWAITAWPSISP